MGLEVHAGDVFFTRGASALGKLIRWVETDPSEKPAWANHTGMVVKSGWLVADGGPGHLAETVEALWRVEHTKWWLRHRYEKGYKVQVWRHLGLLEPEITRISAYALKHKGDKYGWWKLSAHALDRFVFRGDKKISRLLHIDSRPICSYLVARGFEIIGVDFGMPAQATDPDEMLSHCQMHEDWQFVGMETL